MRLLPPMVNVGIHRLVHAEFLFPCWIGPPSSALFDLIRASGVVGTEAIKRDKRNPGEQ